jgi:hypothetical protein
MPFSWDKDTSPFVAPDGRPPARFALRQVDDDTFELLEAFAFRPEAVKARWRCDPTC